jgi:hypothetical protein
LDSNFPLSFFANLLFSCQGLRLVAMTLLPISNDTLVLGSADAGATVWNSDRKINSKVKQAAQKLFLADHEGAVECSVLLLHCFLTITFSYSRPFT